MQPTQYSLRTYATNREFSDSGWMLDDPQCTVPSLIRAIYEKRQIEFGSKDMGLYRFADWLPIHRTLKGSFAPVTYKSVGLAGELGLENLYITFSGYCPEHDAGMTTCSFKETEAYSVCGRIDPDENRVLVVSSAGNTARAFAKVCSENNIKLLLCVPEDNVNALWFENPLNDCVKLVATTAGSDYFDAINLGNIAVESPMFYPEGGAKNVARRDGMATTMLSAVEKIGRVPEFYFQAVGSGTGAIAAWEANLRLIDDGRFSDTKSRLILSQNEPFLPMYRAWAEGRRALHEYDDCQARADASMIDAKVLSNRRPPYAIAGGLFDALSDTNGTIIACSNAEATVAAELFERSECVDIHPAAAIATASLIKAVADGTVSRSSIVMLNITGGGEKRFQRDRTLFNLSPSIIFGIDTPRAEIISRLEELFGE